jgi:capsular polysaccharide biosynthesis protein
VSDEAGRRSHHRQEQSGSRLATESAAPWPETAGPPVNQADPPERLWGFDGLDDITDAPVADVAGGLVSLGFIAAALRRSRWLWCTTAVIGLLVGLGLVVKFPPRFQASTTILLANNPLVNSASAELDNQAIVQSRTVAGDALRKVGLPESGASSFTADYTATVVTNRVLLITVKAKSADLALREANALATAFLAFQASQAETQARLVDTSLQQETAQAQRNIDSISRQIKQLLAQPASPSRHTQLSTLSAQRTEAVSALVVLKQANSANQAATSVNIAQLVKGSQVLDPAVLLPQHGKSRLALYMGGGLIGGLVLGLAVVIIRALVSDRLRRRDDIACALGAPVKLSVGKVKLSRWRAGSRGLGAAQNVNIGRIATYLQRMLPSSSHGPASLAIVAVDDVRVPALCLASLALSRAQPGVQVVVVDLCSGSPVARLLGADHPGVQQVHVDDADLLVAIPEPDDVAPVGPLHPGSVGTEAAEHLAAACASADLLLTLATLDPSLGGDHLAGWAHDAVAIVTAGRSTTARIHAVGEMIRLAGMKLISAVLVGADKTDESLGELDPSVTVGSGSSLING